MLLKYLKNYVISLQRIPGKYKIGVRQKSEIIQLVAGRFLRQGYECVPSEYQNSGERRCDDGYTDSCPIDSFGFLRRIQNRAITGESTAGPARLLRRSHVRTARPGREVCSHELDRTRRECIRFHVRRVNLQNLAVL